MRILAIFLTVVSGFQLFGGIMTFSSNASIAIITMILAIANIVIFMDYLKIKDK